MPCAPESAHFRYLPRSRTCSQRRSRPRRLLSRLRWSFQKRRGGRRAELMFLSREHSAHRRGTEGQRQHCQNCAGGRGRGCAVQKRKRQRQRRARLGLELQKKNRNVFCYLLHCATGRCTAQSDKSEGGVHNHIVITKPAETNEEASDDPDSTTQSKGV